MDGIGQAVTGAQSQHRVVIKGREYPVYTVYEKTNGLNRQYAIVGDNPETKKDALSFMKDWVTSILTLETAALGAIGAFITLKDPSNHLSIIEALILGASAGCFVLSMREGVIVLNQIPAASQRVPVNDHAWQSDIYNIATNEQATREQQLRGSGLHIEPYATRCWKYFQKAALLFVGFIIYYEARVIYLNLPDKGITLQAFF